MMMYNKSQSQPENKLEQKQSLKIVTTYRLKASELDQSFLERLKATYGDREIEITVSNLTTQLEAMANAPSIQADLVLKNSLKGNAIAPRGRTAFL